MAFPSRRRAHTFASPVTMLSLELVRILREVFNRRTFVTRDESESTTSWHDTCESLRLSDPDLDELDVDGSSFTEREWRTFTDALRFSKSLKRLILRQVPRSQCLAPSLKNSKIHALCVEKSDDAEGELMVAISIALFYNHGVKQLHLRDCQLDPVSAPALGFLVQSSAVTELCFNHSVLNVDMIISLSQGLLSNTTLKLLDLTGCQLDDDLVKCLCRGLKGNSQATIEFLSLDFNSFGDDGVAVLSDMLASNQSLTDLHLFGNRVTAIGAEHLSRALTTNDCLQSLILSLNRIGDHGAVALAKALTVNRTLSSLCFPSNFIGQAGMEAFAEYLPRMSGLETLNVGLLLDCKIEEALTLGLKDNLRLSFLHMEKPVAVEFDGEQDESDEPDGSHNPHMDFYLRLNRSGRRLLRQHDTHPGSWAHILANTSCHARRRRGSATVPDVLFYLLRELPDLLDRNRGSSIRLQPYTQKL